MRKNDIIVNTKKDLRLQQNLKVIISYHLMNLNKILQVNCNYKCEKRGQKKCPIA